MADPATRSVTSVAEFLEMERAAPTKHELWNGEVFAMAGASFGHNVLVGNLIHALVDLVQDGPCVVLPSDMKIHVPTSNGYVYPDVSVVCDAPVYIDATRDVITNPRIVVEVLSESTERFDRGEKFVGYRSLSSLQDYLLVSQTQVRIEHYTRGEDGTWVLRTLGPGERVGLVVGDVAVDEIYRKVAIGD